MCCSLRLMGTLGGPSWPRSVHNCLCGWAGGGLPACPERTRYTCTPQCAVCQSAQLPELARPYLFCKLTAHPAWSTGRRLWLQPCMRSHHNQDQDARQHLSHGGALNNCVDASASTRPFEHFLNHYVDARAVLRTCCMPVCSLRSCCLTDCCPRQQTSMLLGCCCGECWRAEPAVLLCCSMSSCKAPLPTVLRREMFMGQRPFMGMSQAQVSTAHSCA